MKKTIILICALIAICLVFLIIAFSAKPTKDGSPVIQFFPTPTFVPFRVSQQVIDTFTSSLPQQGTITIDSQVTPTAFPIPTGGSVDNPPPGATNAITSYNMYQVPGTSSTLLHVEFTGINYQAPQNDPSCQQRMSQVSDDPDNIRFWCDYNFNKQNFLIAAKKIYDNLASQGFPKDYFTIIWSTNAQDQKQAIEWAKEIN